MLDAGIVLNKESQSAGDCKPRRPSLWEIDENRASRIALLAGERGTGKTTVLLSMMRECREAARACSKRF